MNHPGDAAEQIIRISLDGMEHALRIAGSGAKNIAALIMAAMKSDGTDDKLKLKGKERLTNMLKSGKELKIFSMKSSDLEQFSKEAKRYGVVYCALKEKNAKPDSVVDVMAKAEDASKISRIMERLQFAAVDRASIESQMTTPGHDRESPDRDDTDKLIDMLIDKDGKAIPPSPPVADIGSGDLPHPTPARTDENSPSVSRSKTQSKSAEVMPGTKKPESVQEFLRERTAQNQRKQGEKKPVRSQPEAKPKGRQNPPQHRQPPNRGRRKSKKSKER